jgi:hypothetical protein
MSDYVIYITLSFVFIVVCVACICDEGYIIIDRDYYANEVDENVLDVIIDDNGFGDDDNGFGDDDNGFGDNDNGFGDDDNGFGDNDNGFGDNDNGFGDNDNGFGEIQCNPNPTTISDIIPLNSP